MPAPRILDISFSFLERDARVLRQLGVVARHGTVTTVGYGPATRWSDEHVEVPATARSLAQTLPGVVDLALHRHDRVDLAAPAAKHTLAALAGRSFDLVIANDARALPVALEIAAGAPVWVDLHEWAPEERTHVAPWRFLVAPWIDHVCRTHLPRVAAATTVGGRIAELYAKTYGVRPALMRNAAPLANLTPSPVPPNGPIRVVHSGAAVPGRNMEAMIHAIGLLGGSHSLDLYLVPAGDGGRYEHRLRDLAAGDESITFHEPVPPDLLPTTLNAYDIGAFWIPPFVTNARLTLPNKFFDFVQARLALAIGPTVEMVELLESHGLGMVSTGFSAEEAARSLAAHDRADIARFKEASHRAAPLLSFEREAEVADRIMRRLLGTP